MNEEKVNKKLLIIMAIITIIVVGFVAFIVCGGDELIISKLDDESSISSSKFKDDNKKRQKDNNTNISTDSTSNKVNNTNSINNNASNTNKVDNTNSINNNTSDANKVDNNINSDNNNSSKNSDEWNSGEFLIDGVKYCLGDKYSKFVNNGWKLADISDDYTIKGNSIDYGTNKLENEKYKKYLNAYFVNRTENVANINDCQLYSISLSYYKENQEFEFLLPKGITIGKSSKEDVIKAYGQPTNTYSETSLLYKKDSIMLYVYTDLNGIVNSITYSKYK